MEGTRHARTDAVVGHYRLHGGPTEDAAIALGDDVTLVYRRLVRPVVAVACAECWNLPEVRTAWETWGEDLAPRERTGRGPRPS